MRIYYHLLETNTKQQRVKDKEDCASIATSYTKINKQIANCRQKKRHQFDLLQKATRYEVSDKHCTTNEASPKEIKHTCLAATCVILGDSIITGIDEKRLSKNRLGTVHDFSAATLTDINHHIIPILKKQPDESRVRFLMICCNIRVPLLRTYQTVR